MADYKWDCINTKITEIDNWDDQSPSWCKPGIFQPAISRVKFKTSSHANQEMSFTPALVQIQSSMSNPLLRRYPGCELPIDLFPYDSDEGGKDFGMRGITFDNANPANLYCANRVQNKVFRMLGTSGELDNEFDIPAPYNAYPWYFCSLVWYDGNLHVTYYKGIDYRTIKMLKFDGLTNTILSELELVNSGMPSLIGGDVGLTFVTIDPVNNWVVGVGNGYRGTGGYRQRLIRWDLTTGAVIGGDITSTLNPIGNNYYPCGYIDYENNHLYSYNISEDKLYWWDYTEVTTYNLATIVGSLSFGGNYKGGELGLWWEPSKPLDRWAAGSGGATTTWGFKYWAFPDLLLQQRCDSQFWSFTSTASIQTDIASDIDWS